MEKIFIERFDAARDGIRTQLAAKMPESYLDLVKLVVNAIKGDESGPAGIPYLDPERIHEIDDGDYSGTALYLIGEAEYKPESYWIVSVAYGSCTVCDTLKRIQNYSDDDDTPIEESVKQLFQLALHIVQGLRKLDLNQVATNLVDLWDKEENQ